MPLIYNGMPLIYIYDEFSTKIEMPKDKILVVPIITNYRPWTMGYFYTIGNIPVTERDISLNCGFVTYPASDIDTCKNPIYLDLYGNTIDKRPHYYHLYSLTSYNGINYEICKVLGIDT